MAEARQAVAFQFAVTEEGIQIHFDKEAVKSTIKSLLSFTKSRYLRARRALLQGTFPASPLSLIFFVVLVGSMYAGGWDPSLGLAEALASPVKYLGFHGNYIIVSVLICESFFLWVLAAYFQRFSLKALLHYQGWMFDPFGKRSWQTKAWMVAVKAVTMFTKPQLYSYQSSLPRLPVPGLKDTCKRYLKSVKPLLEDQDYREMESLVQDFQNGVGKKLQRYLVLKSWWANNYVTDWWETYVYLHSRSSLMINSNYFACDMMDSSTLTTLPAARAGTVCHILMQLKREIERCQIKPLIVMNTVPLCSAQYERLFGTTRIPGEVADKIVHTKGMESNYCVCYCEGRWYKVPLTTPRGKLLPPFELEYVFEVILGDKEGEVGPGEKHLAALTALKRDEWAEVRETFFTTGVNKVSMEVIEKAAFVLMFEEESPTCNCPNGDCSDFTAYSKASLHGSGYTRWFDKSVTVSIYANGKLGVNAEHSWADAPIIGYVMEYSCNMEHTLCYEDGHCGNYKKGQSATYSTPRRLQWELPEPCVEKIDMALNIAREQIEDLDLHSLKHDDFGKGAMKKCKVSPDAFIQMALQMAYFKDAEKFCLTYEASMTRLFLEGRTETVRPVSELSTQFVRAMCDPKIRDNATDEERRRLLREATEYHAHSYKLAMTGKGIDRHLFCLYVMSKYLKEDSPFLSKVLHEPWRLSTSQTPAQQTGKIDFDKNPERRSGGGGFGPVAKDGYGVSYIFQGDGAILFHVSGFKNSPTTDAFRFLGYIKESLREMKDLFRDSE